MTCQGTLHNNTHRHPGVLRGLLRCFSPAQWVLVPTHPVQQPGTLQPCPPHPNHPGVALGGGLGEGRAGGVGVLQPSPEGTAGTNATCRVCEDQWLHEVGLQSPAVTWRGQVRTSGHLGGL